MDQMRRLLAAVRDADILGFPSSGWVTSREPTIPIGDESWEGVLNEAMTDG